MNARRFDLLEIMRAACCLMVFAGHVNLYIPDLPHRQILSQLLAWGVEAVICFFVLSGCVIQLTARASIKDYLIARATRILPVYYIALMLSVVVAWVVGKNVSVGQLVLNVFFLQNMQGDIAWPLEVNLPTWSLSYEMAYYLIFVLLMARPTLLWPTFVASLIFGASTYLVEPSVGGIAFMQSIMAFFCFWLLGVFVAREHSRGRHLRPDTGAFLFIVGIALSRLQFSANYYDFVRLFMVALGAGALCSALLGSESGESSENGRMHLSFIWRSVIAGLALISLWMFSRSLPATLVFLSVLVAIATVWPSRIVNGVGMIAMFWSKPMIAIGGLSYALYVVHCPVIFGVNHLFSKWDALFRSLIAVGLALMLAYVLDFVIQPRLRHIFRRRIS